MNRKFLQQNVALGNIVISQRLITCNTDISYSQRNVLTMFKNQLNGLYEFPKRDAKRGPLRNRISSVVDRDGKDKYLNDDIEMSFSIGCSAMLSFFSKILPLDYIAIDNLPPVRIPIQKFTNIKDLNQTLTLELPKTNDKTKNTNRIRFNDNNNNIKFILKKDVKDVKDKEWLNEFMSNEYQNLPNENIVKPEDMQNFSYSHFKKSNILTN